MRLLVTRPIDEAERTACRLRKLGHESLLAPLLQIEAIADATWNAGGWQAVLMTSGNAARMLAQHPQRAGLLSLPLFAVGGRTAEAAREAGFADVISAEGDAGDLVRLVGARIPPRGARLLYLAGDDRARDLPGELSSHGLAVDTVVVYRAAACALGAEAQHAMARGDVSGVLHYSRRTAEIFLRAVNEAGLNETAGRLMHYCLSQRVAEPLQSAGFRQVRVARQPDEDALLGLLAG
ncbi:MAG: uroporphyrinogen-III synthase [Pseudorhodoplanes sp.]|nr:uroporphyrinogen-III synthase [Pseudorhodoplanes sp.]